MEFGPSEEQSILQMTVNRYLEENSQLDRVREIAVTWTGHDDAIWSGLAELGVIGLIVPVEFGGSGLGMFEAALVCEALGRNITPAPFLGSGIMVPVALMEAGTAAQKREHLPGLAAGETKIGIAVTEAVSSREGAGVRIKDGKLSGKALFAIDAETADKFLIAAGSDTLAIAVRNADGLTINALKSIDRTRSIAELELRDVECEIVGSEGGSADAVARVIDAGRVAIAADTVGAAAAMRDKAVVYSRERFQFERPIGSFQAVKHMCAEMTADLEPALALVWYAAHAFDNVPDESRLMASQAKSHLSEVGTFVARTSTEVHGGMGFTDLMGLHYWFKRVGLNRQLLGSPEQARLDAARAQGWAA